MQAQRERAACAFSEARLCTVEWSWPITQDTRAAQLPFSGAQQTGLGRRDLFFFSTLDSSSLKTSVRSEALPGKTARLNSKPAQQAET